VMVKRGQEAGEIISRMAAGDITWFILSLIQGAHSRAWMTGSIGDIDRTIDTMIDFVKQGIGTSHG
jgi:hypothetical protein